LHLRPGFLHLDTLPRPFPSLLGEGRIVQG
jgi:hypothetical protein